MRIKVVRERTEIVIPSCSPEVVRQVLNAVFGPKQLPARRPVELDDILPEGEEVIFDSEGGYRAR